MIEKRFTIKKSGNGLFYSDGDYSIDNTIQFVIETVEFKLNQLYDENKQLKKELFESRCEYIYDTADISDTPYIDEEIEEMRKNIFEKGVYGID